MNSSAHTHLVQHQPDHLFYIESSLPPGVTINEYRRRRARVSRWRRFRQQAGGGAAAATA